MLIEEYLSVPVKRNDTVVIPNTLPIEDQLEFLISTNFKLLKSPQSKLWRLEHLYFITNKDREKIKFKLNKAQKHFLEQTFFKGFKRIIILKARQLGFTTLMSIYFLDEVIFNPNSEALQIAHKVEDVEKFFNNKVKFAVNNLPKTLLPLLGIVLNTNRAKKLGFSYPDDSTSAISVSTSGRSGMFNYVHISELAKLCKMFPEKGSEVLTGTIPAIPTSGFLVIESTAEGMQGEFYEMFQTSWKRRFLITPQMSKAELYPVFYNWTWDTAEIDASVTDGIIAIENMELCEIDWKQYKEDNELSDKEITFYYIKYIQLRRDIDKLHQEYPTTSNEAFIGTGSNFFSLKKIYNFLEHIDKTQWNRFDFVAGELLENPLGDVWIREDALPGRVYVVGGDIAQGLETGDYTAFAVVGLDKDIKALYRGHCEPNDAAKLAELLGRRYNNALLAIESNQDGNWCNTELINQGYTNVYMRNSFDDITKTVTNQFGWNTNAGTRKFMLDNMKVWFNSLTELQCEPLLQEMLAFVRNKMGKPMAMGTDHDDLIFATGIALAVIGIKKDLPFTAKKQKSLMDYIFES